MEFVVGPASKIQVVYTENRGVEFFPIYRDWQFMHKKNRAMMPLFLAVLVFWSSSLAVFAQDASPPAAPAPASYSVDNGTHVLDATSLANTSSLNVASGATLLIDVGSHSNLSFSGDIANSGNIFAFSSNSQINSATFSALNIFNNQGAVLSSVIPTSALAGINSAVSILNLNLSAINQIINAGTISSSGALAMSAGNSITNTGTMSAVSNLSALVGAGGLINSGIMASMTSNVNIASLAAQNLMFNNTNGSVQALLGNINLNTGATTEKLLMNVLGGDFVSRELNLTNLNGMIEANIGDVTGPINVSAGGIHLQAAANNLMLGRLNLTGDPTFYNTGVVDGIGDITITSDIDLRPVNFTPPGQVALAIVASGQITAQPGVTTITINAGPNNINGLGWPGAQNAGSMLIVAGANFSAAPDNSNSSASAGAPPVAPPGPGDTTSTLTITGGSTGGGSINLTGVSLNTQAGQAGNTAISGDITLVAYGGSTHNGNIAVGNINSGNHTSTLPANDVASLNGNVTIVGSGNITTGTINTAGSIQPSPLYNGNVTIASATPLMIQSPIAGNAWPASQTTTNSTLIPAGSTTFQVLNPGSLANGNTIYLDPTGTDAETAVISNITGNTVTVSAPLVNNHVIGERVYIATASVIVNPGAGVVNTTPITQNGAIFAADMSNIQGGNIATGVITAGGDVNMNTTGTATINGNIGLTQNPTTAPPTGTAYLRFPSVNINAQGGITVASGMTVSSEIANCPFCFNSVNLNTNNLVVSSTAAVVGYVVNIASPAGTGMSILNNGTITGGAMNGGAATNAFVAVRCAGGLQLSGTGTIQTPGAVSVILLAAADGSTFAITSSHNFATGTDGLVILNAQRSGGTINVAAASTLNFGTGSDNPTVVINTPSIILNNTSNLLGASMMTFTSGLAINTTDGLTPLPLTITVPGGASASISANFINIHPLHNANLILSTTSPSFLNISGAAILATSGTGTINTSIGFSITGNYNKVTDPSGGIRGIAFQPFVGPYVNQLNGYTGAAVYSYQQVLALMAPLAATGQFQVLSTYTQIGQSTPPYYSSSLVIPAAKDIGFQVSAGVFVTFDTSGNITSPVDVNGNPIDLQPALTAAATYGNVIDIVVGNEDIVGGANPELSIAALTAAITAAQGLRNTTTNPLTGSAFTSATLPVTTRQIGGVYDVINPSFGNPTAATNMVTLLQTVDGYVYGNFYPFFNTDVIAALTCPSCTGYAYNYIGMSASQTQFTSLIQTNMSTQYNTVANDFVTYVTSSTPVLKIGETGWGTQGVPQASTTYASYYYSAMQGWSATTTDPVTSTTGVPILGYFEAFNEPNKPTDKGPPASGTVTVATANNIGDMQLVVSNSSWLSGVGQVVIYPAPQRVVPPNQPPPYIQVAPPEEFANVQPPNGSTPANTLVLFSPLQYAHNVGDIVNVGEGAEPYFGIWVANGTSPGAPGYAAPSTYVLNSISQTVTLSYYNLPGPVPPIAAVQNPTTATATTTANANSLATIAFANTMSQAAINLSRDPGTILPTDINPQAPPANAFQQMNAGQQSTVTLAGTQLNGNIAFNASGSNQPFFSLPSGNGLFTPKQDMVVATSVGDVQIGANSVVMILQNEHGMSVFNFHDVQTGDVKVAINGQSVTLAPGRQLFVTKDANAKFDDMSPTGIGIRNVSETKIGDAKLFQTEFSMTAALTKLPALKQLLLSSDKKDRDKASKILKTAAAMSIVGQNKSPFKRR